jgi:hypothetical protein
VTLYCKRINPQEKRAQQLNMLEKRQFLLIRDCTECVKAEAQLLAILAKAGITCQVASVLDRGLEELPIRQDAQVLLMINSAGSAHCTSKVDTLDRLCQWRNVSKAVEIHLGYSITGDNIDECLQFLTICEQFGSKPIYLLDLTSDGGSLTTADVKRYAVCLDKLNKALFGRAWPRTCLEVAVRQLGTLMPEGILQDVPWVQYVYADLLEQGRESIRNAISLAKRSRHTVSIGLQISKALASENVDDSSFSIIEEGEHVRYFGVPSSIKVPVEIALDVGECTKLDCERILDDIQQKIRHVAHPKHLAIATSPAVRDHWSLIHTRLSSLDLDSCSMIIPFWANGHPVSVLDWLDVVACVRGLCLCGDWRLEGGRPDLLSLGLDISNQFPKVRDIRMRRRGSKVSLSIISPVYNLARQLPAFLGSIAASKIHQPIEIVLIDDGSTDDSWNVLLETCYALRSEIDFVLLRLHRRTPYVPNSISFRTGVARQIGLDYIRASRVLFLDADQTVEENCLAEHIYWGEVGFDVVLGVRDSPAGSIAHRTRMRLRHVAPIQAYEHWWGWFFTGNVSVSRKALDAAGGFDIGLHFWGLDDMDLGYRLEKTGARFFHTPHARVTHLPGVTSGGGGTREDRAKSCRFQMEVLYRKYLDDDILSTYRRFW